MMRQHAAVQSANGLLPFGHVGWGYRNRDESFSRAAEYIADGLRHNRCITYASEGTHAALRSELAAMPGIGEHLDSGGIVVMPLEVFYIFGPGSGIVDAQRMLAKYLAAAEQAITRATPACG